MYFDPRTYTLNTILYIKSKFHECLRSRKNGSGKTKETDPSRSFRGILENNIRRNKEGYTPRIIKIPIEQMNHLISLKVCEVTVVTFSCVLQR